ncbi:MAG: sugar O-acetyltransferase [Muribaculaceae bacterium]|nr:sugar O-acetyltransferase [Muribaculaceae bacterium]
MQQQENNHASARRSSEILSLLADGMWVHAGAKDHPEISGMLGRCADLCHEINMLKPSQGAQRQKLFRELLGSTGDTFIINSPFRCDFGFNIHIGENFIGNFNLSILDEAPVNIGRNVMIGPNCSLLTIIHAFDPAQRNDGIMKAKPITIGDDVWIAANVVILPGVTIGEGAVIGAGSVVTHSIPARVLAAGNPCKVLREITEQDVVNTEY